MSESPKNDKTTKESIPEIIDHINLNTEENSENTLNLSNGTKSLDNKVNILEDNTNISNNDHSSNENGEKISELSNITKPPPEPLRKPHENECCNSGCNPCILDAYVEQKQKYEEFLGGVREMCSAIFQRKNCIYPTSYSLFRLIQRTKHTENSVLLTFQYVKTENMEDEGFIRRNLQYKPGQHFIMKQVEGEFIIQRAYTPIPTLQDDDTSFTILVKLYENGKMSDIIKTFKVGHEVLFRGPYFDFKIDKNLHHLFLIAQGTGIAPLYAITKEILSDLDCETFIHLFLCCRGKDLYLRRDIYRLKESWNFRYEIFLTNSNVEPWYTEKMHKRRMEFEDIQTYLTDKLEKNVQVLIAGSEDFEKNIKSFVVKCGATEDKILLFE